MILIGGGILCPDCVTEDDIVANRRPEFGSTAGMMCGDSPAGAKPT
jgi:hypothetical protein